MGEQSASRLKGDDYQHLYSWHELLQLLDPDAAYSFGYVEHPEAGAADDITLHADTTFAKFTQVKFHVDHRSQYSSSSVIEVPSGSTRSMLHKLYDSWKALRKSNIAHVEIWLVSNWASAEDLGEFLLDSCALKDEFFSATARTNAGKIRSTWGQKIGATEEDLHQFCRALRLRLGYSGFQELEERVDDRMARYGLRCGKDPRAIALDIVRGWIKEGGAAKRIDRSMLEAAILQRGLRATPSEQPKVSLWVHGWARRHYDLTPTVELDWTSHFRLVTRSVPSQQLWSDLLGPQLRNARTILAGMDGGTYIDFRGKLPLTASLAIGQVFSEAFGIRFRAEQPSGGELVFWRSDAGIEPFALKSSDIEVNSDATEGVAALSITGDAGPDVQRLIQTNPTIFRAFLNLTPQGGPTSTAVHSGGQAVSIAIQVKEELRRFRSKYNLSTLHLVLYCPATVALFLGQRMNALGNIRTWERSADATYQPSVTLSTG